jgi:Tol biopolymer transport system component
MSLSATPYRALAAVSLLSLLCLAAARPAPAAPPVPASSPGAPVDTTGLTPLQKVMLQARQLGAAAPVAAPDTLTLPAGVRRLTTTPLDEGRCAWSPDGRSLYYDVLDGGQRRLVRMDLATGEVSSIADPPREGFSPAVSPDGRFLVFTRNLPELHYKLWVMRLEDGEEAKLTDNGSSLHENSPAWSESGGLVYYSVSNNGTPNATPMVVTRTGENAEALEQGGGSYQTPAPSPSGKQIAWVIRFGASAFLRIVDARISALSEDFEFPGYFLSTADWLPGERRFVVSYLTLSAPLDGYRLGLVDLDRRQLEPWLDLPAALDPRVSPDGRQVAFRARVGGSYELFLADLP